MLKSKQDSLPTSFKVKIIVNSLLQIINIKYRFVFYFDDDTDECIDIKFKKWQ